MRRGRGDAGRRLELQRGLPGEGALLAEEALGTADAGEDPARSGHGERESAKRASLGTLGARGLRAATVRGAASPDESRNSRAECRIDIEGF